MSDPAVREDISAPIDLSLEVDRLCIFENSRRLAGLERRENIPNCFSCRRMEIDELINDVSQLLGIEVANSFSYS